MKYSRMGFKYSKSPQKCLNPVSRPRIAESANENVGQLGSSSGIVRWQSCLAAGDWLLSVFRNTDKKPLCQWREDGLGACGVLAACVWRLSEEKWQAVHSPNESGTIFDSKFSLCSNLMHFRWRIPERPVTQATPGIGGKMLRAVQFAEVRRSGDSVGFTDNVARNASGAVV
jgi:hypothetical protein